MNIDNWSPFYKYNPDGTRAMAQQTYEPLVSPDKKTFCLNYDANNSYQRAYEERPLYTQEVCDYFFEKELSYMTMFKDAAYAPEVIDVDSKNKRIFIKWYNSSCNHDIYKNLILDLRWFQELKDIMQDQHRRGIYKLTMYPHCYYTDNHGQMRTIDWYGCVPIVHPYIDKKYMDAIIHETAQFRLDETGDSGNKYNLEIMFKRGLQEHVMWGKSNMNYIYKELFDA